MERQPRQATLDDTALETTATAPTNSTPPTPPEATQLPQSSISTSEPTLRFPRPTVNQHLASWISSSQPDIMSPSSHPVEDSGLSESTYEFITTDDESQDGIATESLQSFGESRPDDVRSLAGSEPSESGIDTDSDSDEEVEHDEEKDEEEQNEEDTRSQASSIQYTEETLNSPSPCLPSHSDVLSIDDETVHLSVESTQKAGDTLPAAVKPSSQAFLTSIYENFRRLVASLCAETAEDLDDTVVAAKKVTEDMKQQAREAWEGPWTSRFHLAIMSSALVIISMIAAAYNLQAAQVESAPANVFTTTSTVVATTPVESASDIINLTSSTSTTLLIPRANAAASNSAVIPFANLLPDIIPDTAKVPVCSAGIHSTNEILIKMPLSTKTTWLAKDSITIDVLRDGQAVKTRFSSIDEGLVIEIPFREAHGIISVRVITSRRPKVNETFEVDFGSTLLGKALGLADIVAETAGDFGKRATAAGGSIASGVKDKSGWLGCEVASTTDHVKSFISKEAAFASEKLKQAQLGVQHVRYQVQDSADLAQLNILRAQITSRLWWLKMQFKTDEYEQYRLRAKTHLAEQYATLRHAMQERRSPDKTAKCLPKAGFWARHKCADHAPRS
ncbi:hypothetical protein F5X68DRAFT_46672 [Plectosphaerella plurivora]|uniref:Uncharacterized protein n=1 Tax=Plectosphaerella plurivora TaxID=936078 RepID=A0A9P9AER7_9PEZI|nr:hypothetical protein F5X68DRAFT_46672 [Plectosphaerella plurivora]